MADRVKGITVEIGGDVTGLNKALAGTNKEIKSTQAQLKDVEKLLKLDPTNTTLLEQKQRLLADAIGETESKLDTLKAANDQVAGSVKNYDAWKKAYDPIQEEIKETNEKLKELKAQRQELNDSGKMNTDEFKNLQAEIDKTTADLKDLKSEAKKVSEEFGNPISQSQYDALQREIIDAQQELNKLEDRAKDAQSALEKVDEQPVEDVKTAADKAGDSMEKLKDAANKVKSGVDNIASASGNVQQAFAPVTTAAVGLAGAVIATVPATEELREDLSKLDASAKDNRVSVEAARDAWRAFAVQSGETDSAVEATANLLQAGFTESNLQTAVEGLAGAAQRFPDTLKIESLADSLQETLATGSATGQFGELLDRLGIGAENFSAQLAECKTEAEAQNLVLQTLASEGLNESYNAWKQNNEEMLANKEANLAMQESLAELAEIVLPYITMVIEKVSELIDWFTGLDSETQILIATIIGFVAAISPVAGAISGISSAISFLIANPIVALVAAIVALVVLIAAKGDEIQAILQELDDWLQGVFATDWTEIFGPLLGESLNAFFAIVKDVWDSIKLIFDGVIDFIRGVFTGDWERAWNGVVEIFGGIFSGIAALTKAPFNLFLGMVNKVINAINTLISGLNKIHFTLPSWLGGGSFGINLPTIPNLPYLANGGILDDGSAIVGDAGPELLTVGNGRAVVQPLPGNTGKIESLLGSIDSRIGGQGELTIVVPLSLNGRIIGEETYRYIQNRGRANG